jgi:hydrogenase maturation factor
MYTLFGIGLLVAVALLAKPEQRKGAWVLVAVVVVLVVIAERLR